MIASADTAGKPSLGWRGRRAAERLSERVSSALPGSDDAVRRTSAKKSRTDCTRAPNGAANWPTPQPNEARRTPKPPWTGAANWPAPQQNEERRTPKPHWNGAANWPAPRPNEERRWRRRRASAAKNWPRPPASAGDRVGRDRLASTAASWPTRRPRMAVSWPMPRASESVQDRKRRKRLPGKRGELNAAQLSVR